MKAKMRSNSLVIVGVRGLVLAGLLLGHGLTTVAGSAPGSESLRTGWTPFQFSVWVPLQLFDETRDVYGLRTSLFHGENRKVHGIDISLFANSADDVYGVSILVFGNEAFFTSTFSGWTSVSQERAPNIHGVQIAGGMGAGIMLLPWPLFAVAAVGVRAGDVNGAQVSLIANNADRVRGVQIAGLVNTAQTGMTGLQLSGAGNKAKGHGRAVQIGALIGNETAGRFGGLQLGLMGSDNAGDYTGLSFGVFGHRTKGHMRGWQISGIGNVSGPLDGAQTSGLFNRARSDGRGLQLGALNFCDRITGVQIGALNYARTMTGIQIGALNIIRESSVPIMVGVNARLSF